MRHFSLFLFPFFILAIEHKDEEKEEKDEERDDMVNPFWIEDKDLGNGPLGKLNSTETEFFKVGEHWI